MTPDRFPASTLAITPPPPDSLAGRFAGKRVLVTGHTGFKGAWLSEWLLNLGAEVWGFSLPPPTSPSLFAQLHLESRVARHIIGDIRELTAVSGVVGACRPQFVFHLAAQPLVRASYVQPVETYAVNVMGTVNVLEALRTVTHPCAAVMVTTDKCYENREWEQAYREEDALGGHDPYSSSKGAAEIAISAFRRSFFPPDRLGQDGVPPVAVASARAGNVIGGGDWAPDRIMPDCMRSLAAGASISLRHPRATRPWQHVLEPLSGYLVLAATLGEALAARQADRLAQCAAAFNFGPNPESNRTVAQLVDEVLGHWPGRWEDHSDPRNVHEAKLLSLAIGKAARILDWQPRWTFERTVAETVGWYRAVARDGANGALALTQRQIAEYGALRARQILETSQSSHP